MPNKDQIRSFELSNTVSRVTLLNLGCITQSWFVAALGNEKSIVLGYRSATDYLHNPHYLGAIVGRVANRIAAGRFIVDGQPYQVDTNEPPHTLHGGANGISGRIWDVDCDGSRAVQMRLHSANGDQGFPGTVDFSVTITLCENRLEYSMEAHASHPTPINMAQHSYYNLAGGGLNWQHTLQINADSFLPTDLRGIPIGDCTTLDGTDVDFRRTITLKQADPKAQGIDSNYCLAPAPAGAHATLALGDTRMEVETDQPGLQVYTASKLAQIHEPLQNQQHDPFSAVCLEPQGYPNAINMAQFPSILITPETPYKQVLRIALSTGQAM
jgi:aldose 1-epimerase